MQSRDSDPPTVDQDQRGRCHQIAEQLIQDELGRRREICEPGLGWDDQEDRSVGNRPNDPHDDDPIQEEIFPKVVDSIGGDDVVLR